MTEPWQHVAAHWYGLTRCTLWGDQQHHGRHWFLRADDGRRLVLSATPAADDRPPFPGQFLILDALHDRGFDLLRPPVMSFDHTPCVLYDGAWWVLRAYAPSDSGTDWSSPSLVDSAARTLATLHTASRRLDLTAYHRALDPERVGSFHWSARETVDRLDRLLADFDDHGLSPADRDFISGTVETLRVQADKVLQRSADAGLVGLTHQDFRPANLRAVAVSVAEVRDWDLARPDALLVDVAFAALQFGGRECLFPDVSLCLAERFVDHYTRALGDTATRQTVVDLLPWFLRFVVCKRLLHNWHVPDRVQLLRRLDSWPLRQAVNHA